MIYINSAGIGINLTRNQGQDSPIPTINHGRETTVLSLYIIPAQPELILRAIANRNRPTTIQTHDYRPPFE